MIEAPPMDTMEGGRRRRMYGPNQGRRIHIKFIDIDIGSQSTANRCTDSHVALKDHVPQVP